MTPSSASKEFARLMATARERTLTTRERLLLRRSQIALRRARRPAMNRKPNLRRTVRKAAPKPNTRRKRTVARKNAISIESVGRALEVRYQRTIGRQKGLYKHEFTKKAGVYTVPPGWFYVPERSIVIASKIKAG